MFELETPVQRFVLEVLESEAHLIVPDRVTGKGFTKDSWRRDVDIVIVNTFGKGEGKEALGRGFSLDDTGQLFGGLTRERVRQLVANTIEHLHTNSPDWVKERYSLKDLLSKPAKPEFMHAKKGGGVGRRIVEACLMGAKLQDLSQFYRRDQISKYRALLPEYGLAIPYDENMGKHKVLIDRIGAIKPDDPAGVKQELLDQVTTRTLAYTEMLKPFLLTVTDLMKAAGLHFRYRSSRKADFDLITQALSEGGISLANVPTRNRWRKKYLFAVDQDQGIQVLQTDPRLAIFRRRT